MGLKVYVAAQRLLVGLLVGVIGGHFFVHLPQSGFGEIPGDGRDSGNPQHGLITRHPIEGKDTNGHAVADQEDACCSQFEIFLLKYFSLVSGLSHLMR